MPLRVPQVWPGSADLGAQGRGYGPAAVAVFDRWSGRPRRRRYVAGHHGTLPIPQGVGRLEKLRLNSSE